MRLANTGTRSDRFDLFLRTHKERQEKLETCNENSSLSYQRKEQRATWHRVTFDKKARTHGHRAPLARLSSTAPPPPAGRRSTTTTTVHNHHHPSGTRFPPPSSGLPAALSKTLRGCVLAGLHRPEQRAQDCSSSTPTHDARAHDQGRRHLRSTPPLRMLCFASGRFFVQKRRGDSRSSAVVLINTLPANPTNQWLGSEASCVHLEGLVYPTATPMAFRDCWC